jgi:large subunit ribosomal protein L24
MKIRKGDLVKVIAGSDKNKQGKVIEALPKENKVVVEGINLKFKHQRRSPEYRRGAILEIPHPINVSNVMLICSHCGKPTRVGWTITESGEKIRKCKKCKQLISYSVEK